MNNPPQPPYQPPCGQAPYPQQPQQRTRIPWWGWLPGGTIDGIKLNNPATQADLYDSAATAPNSSGAVTSAVNPGRH